MCIRDSGKVDERYGNALVRIGNHEGGTLLSGDGNGRWNHGDLFRRLSSQEVAEDCRDGGRGRTVLRRWLWVPVLIIHVLVQKSAMIRKTSQVAEYVTTVLAFVYLIPPVSLDVCPEVVPSSVPASADVASERLLPGVDPHVPTEVSGTDELAATHPTRKGSLRLGNVTAVGLP